MKKKKWRVQAKIAEFQRDENRCQRRDKERKSHRPSISKYNRRAINVTPFIHKILHRGLFVVNASTWSTVEQHRNIFIHIFPWILFHE